MLSTFITLFTRSGSRFLHGNFLLRPPVLIWPRRPYGSINTVRSSCVRRLPIRDQKHKYHSPPKAPGLSRMLTNPYHSSVEQTEDSRRRRTAVPCLVSHLNTIAQEPHFRYDASCGNIDGTFVIYKAALLDQSSHKSSDFCRRAGLPSFFDSSVIAIASLSWAVEVDERYKFLLHRFFHLILFAAFLYILPHPGQTVRASLGAASHASSQCGT